MMAGLAVFCYMRKYSELPKEPLWRFHWELREEIERSDRKRSGKI